MPGLQISGPMKKKNIDVEWFKEFTPIENCSSELRRLLKGYKTEDDPKGMRLYMALHELFIKLRIEEREMFEKAYWRGYFDCDKYKRRKSNPAERFYKELYGPRGYEKGIFNPKLDYNES